MPTFWVGAGDGVEVPVALMQHIPAPGHLPSHASQSLKAIDILREVAAQFAAGVKLPDEEMGWCRHKVTGQKLFRKVEERFGVLVEELEVKHALWVWEVIFAQPCVDAVLRPEVGNATADRDPSAGEHDDSGRIPDQTHGIVEGIVLWKLLPDRRLHQRLQQLPHQPPEHRFRVARVSDKKLLHAGLLHYLLEHLMGRDASHPLDHNDSVNLTVRSPVVRSGVGIAAQGQTSMRAHR